MEIVQDMLNKVRKTVCSHGMAALGDRVIVAVSGGPDSVCLLDVLSRLSKDLDISLLVAHFDHGLRQAEDESETRLVNKLAKSIGLPFITEKASLVENGVPPSEEKARDARYLFLERIREKHGAQKIATGHNMNDQAETVIMRLLRGSGPSGLSGIPPVRENLFIRPLINIKREAILDYLSALKIPYALDSSNMDKRYLRNRIRLELFPLLREYQPRLIEHFARLSEILIEEERFIEQMVAKWVEENTENLTDEGIALSLLSFDKLSIAFKRRITRHILKKINKGLYRLDFDHIMAVINLTEISEPQASLDLPNFITVRKRYDRLYVSKKSQDSPVEDFIYFVEGEGSIFLEEIQKTLTIEELESVPENLKEDFAFTVFLDAEKLPFPLTVRSFRPGDRLRPLGMTGSKKVKDLFIDLKVPVEKRRQTPILIVRDMPVWVCGFRIDDRFKVTSSTKKVLKVSISHQ